MPRMPQTSPAVSALRPTSVRAGDDRSSLNRVTMRHPNTPGNQTPPRSSPPPEPPDCLRGAVLTGRRGVQRVQPRASPPTPCTPSLPFLFSAPREARKRRGLGGEEKTAWAPELWGVLLSAQLREPSRQKNFYNLSNKLINGA